MPELTILARWTALVFAACLAIILSLKMLFGSIPLAGLLTGDRGDGSDYFSFGRTQLLVSTVIIAAVYLKQVNVSHPAATLPNLSPSTLAVLPAGHSTYFIDQLRSLHVFYPSDQL